MSCACCCKSAEYTFYTYLSRLVSVLSCSLCLSVHELPQQHPLTSFQDGKVYIHNLTVGEPHQDQRAKGWNLAVKSTYDSLEDMEYYDKECTAHAELKRVTAPTREESLVVFYENVL